MFRFPATVRVVVVGGAISRRALFSGATPPMFVGTLLVGPLLPVFLFVSPGREPGAADDRFHLVGNAVPTASASCVYGPRPAALTAGEE
ncbi:hypothetical protein [Streptomyces sp. SID5770]|uniref:hypothetical protein n=1 Tax=unclassified Streptomyces TaxID=2593676 RepID=UPI0019276509|nr:hypothetical protein [Streptomyces sp. SID5770]